MSAQEVIYYRDENILVSNARVVINSETYAVANITTVSAQEIPPNKSLGLTIFVSAFLGAGLLGGISNWIAVAGFILMIVGAVLVFTAKPTYSIKIRSVSGETKILVSSSNDYIQVITSAINQAIVGRG